MLTSNSTSTSSLLRYSKIVDVPYSTIKSVGTCAKINEAISQAICLEKRRPYVGYSYGPSDSGKVLVTVCFGAMPIITSGIDSLRFLMEDYA